jgi:sortase A
VGHMPGTALPWEPGNVGLVAHRDSFFRRLGEIKIGDAIRITVPGSEFTYRVTFTDIVDPREIWVLQAATGDTLTLITCYPFHFIGAAPKRFVVRARRLDARSFGGLSPQQPESVTVLCSSRTHRYQILFGGGKMQRRRLTH